MKRLPEEDLLHIFNHTVDFFEELRNKSVFITGGTGFIGKWLVESFLYLNAKTALNTSLTLLTRNKQKFTTDYPHLASDPSIGFVEGDIADFHFPAGKFSFILHAAIDYKEDSLALFDSCVNGTRHLLDFAVHCHAEKVLLISSGAIYGKQPSGVSHIPEEFSGSPNPMGNGSSYGMAKRVSEYLGCEYARKNNFQVKIARCFAFAGPYLPLNLGSAIGNFIQFAIMRQNIIIKGDGTPLRSYMYASDLTIWLWTILFKGESCRPYNVGSEEEISISDLASEVITIIAPSLKKTILTKAAHDSLPERYIPLTRRARTELSLDVWVTRKDAIIKMSNYLVN
jgi:dTDP-glucose 4,6-dehydratase